MTSPWNGAVLLDKGPNLSSFAALGTLKKEFKTRRVGHTGTLDPFATGLLVALVGPATRCARFFSGLPKSYIAEFTFGFETDTDDCTGRPTLTAEVPDEAAIHAALSSFIGEIDQVPPAYSAVHVSGARAYKRARRGEQVELPSRRIVIHGLEAESLSTDKLRVEIRCSTGTYVRSLARDLGRAVGSAAHVSALRRTAVGPFEVSEVGEACFSTIDIHDALIRAGCCVRWDVDARIAAALRNGAQPGSPPPTGERVIAVYQNTPVAIGSWNGTTFGYELVFSRSET